MSFRDRSWPITLKVPLAVAALMVLVGIGGIVMAIVLLLFLYAFVETIRNGVVAGRGQETSNLPTVNWTPATPGSASAMTGTIVMVVMLIILFALTWLTFGMVEGLPG